jgi:GNAT superfamily N-acetyltransferase
MLKVRRATEEDRLSLFKLSLAMHNETDFQHLTLNPQKLLDNLGVWIHQQIALVVTDEDFVVGMLFASVQTPWFSDESYGTEDLFYVLPGYRGSRAGYMLMREFMRVMKQSQVRHIRGGVSTGTGPGAERLYEHFGLKHMGGNFIAHLKE